MSASPFVAVLGLAGVVLGALAALTLDAEAGAEISSWRLLAVALSGAITATLLYDLVRSLAARRGLAGLALRSALLLVNGIYFVGQLVVVTAAASTR